MVKPTTVYLDPRLLQAIKMKAVQTRTNVSSLVNDALRISLKEDIEDIKVINSRKHESASSFEDVLKGLKKDGII